MRMKFSARIHPSLVRTTVSSTYWGGGCTAMMLEWSIFHRTETDGYSIRKYLHLGDVWNLRLLLGTLKP